MIVECGMCYDLYELEDWKEGNIFICIKCAKTLEKIRKLEIEAGRELNDVFKLALFDKMRSEMNND